ncbi:MAG: hypothetical protein ACM3Q4_15570 [Acidobacteriota bacterium]
MTLAFFSAADCAWASFERLAQPASLAGRALAGCAGTDADCVQKNPASPAGITSVHLSLFHSPSPFGLPELSRIGMSAAMPFHFGTLQCTATRFGSSLYREHALMLTYAVKLDEAFAAGISYSYNALSIERYGSAHASGIDLGIQASPVTGLTLGASVLNVNHPAIGSNNDELPRIVMLGMSYAFGTQARFALDIVKDVRYPESVHAGVEASPVSFLLLRTGASTGPARLYGGLGIRLSAFEIQYAVVTHQELGLTHTFGISIDP